MFLQAVNENQNQTNYINQFLGYNHNPIVGNGELYDMDNLTSDYYPLLSPRKKRSLAFSVGQSKWETVSLTWSEEATVDITKAYATYTADVVCTGRDTYKLEFTYDDDYISHAKLNIYLNGVLEFEQTFMSPSCEYQYLTDKDTTTMKIEVIAYGDPETFDSTQITSYLTDRDLNKQVAIIRGILCKNNKLAYVVGQKLYYDTTEVDFTSFFPADDDKSSDLQLISFGALILIFPVGLYFNTKLGTYGSLGIEYLIESATVNYSICNASGTDYTATESATAPNNPSDGDYWLDTGSDVPGLYVYYGALSIWQPIATTYIKIEITGADFSAFEEGDAVYLNTKFSDINEGSIIKALGLDSFIVEGIMSTTTDTETIDFLMERRLPKLDFVCVSQNRVWGCYAGSISGSDAVNEIYACKLGDPTNWYVYEGLSTDSYALSLGEDGDFTGAITYQGYPMFFKENVIYKIFGNYPAAYQLVTYDCRGVQKGSDKSLCVIGEVLMYKSIKDICVWDGSTPTGVSEKLGNEMFYDAVAGASMNKYYVSMRDDKGVVFFVYDISKGMWHKEDDLDIEQFTYNNSGQLYGKNGLNIYGFGLAADDYNLTPIEAEKHVNWSATFGKQYAIRSTRYNTFDSVEKVKPGKTIIRADVPVNSEFSVFVSYDDRPFEKVATIRGEENAQEIQFVPVRCDHYQIKFVGRDDCKVYLMHTEFTQGSVR